MRPKKVREGLYLSNGDIARQFGDEFEHVITLSRDDYATESVGSHEHTTWHVPLIDGENEQADFDRAVGAVIKSVQNHSGDVLVHCQAGVSRSPAVVATAVAYMDEKTYDDAVNVVWSAKSSISPHPAFRDLAEDFLSRAKHL